MPALYRKAVLFVDCCQSSLCCNTCGSMTCCCTQITRCSSSDFRETYRVYRYRYEPVPMRIYYGPGYTVENVLESMETSLQRIADRI